MLFNTPSPHFGGIKKATAFWVPILALSSLGCLSLQAQDEPEFSLDFNTDPSAFLEIINSGSGPAEWRASGGVDDSGYIALTDAVNGSRSAIIFETPVGSMPITGMNFSVDARIGGGTDSPADGFSINIVRPIDPLLEEPRGEGYAGTTDIGAAESNLPEEGSQTGLGIGFDAWVSGGQDIIGISVRVDGVLVEQIPAPVLNGEPGDSMSLQTGPQGSEPGSVENLTWQPFEVNLQPPTADDPPMLTISWKGEVVLDSLALENFNAIPNGSIVFGARTGDANQNHHFDNLVLDVIETNEATLTGITVTRTLVQFEFLDNEGSDLVQDSVALAVNGESVEPTISFNETTGVTTVTYMPATPFETASIVSYELTAMDTLGNNIGRTGTFALPVPVFPFDPLPGPEPESGFWAVRHLWGSGMINSSAEAIAAIEAAGDGTWEGEIHDSLYQTINFGTGGIFPDPQPYPEDVTSSPVWTGDDFVQFSRGYLTFPEAGDYTFGVHSDDGMGLRIHGLIFDEASATGGTIDPADPSAFVFPLPTGDSNSRILLRDVQPGTYLAEFFWWERASGDYGELYVSRGAHLGDDTGSWSLVGATEGGTFAVPGIAGDGWSVMTSEPGGDLIESNTAALAELASVTESTTHASINFNDPGFGGPGVIPGDEAFPGNTEADDDDYAILATGTLVVGEAGTYWLGFQGDDGGYLQVEGQTFDELIVDATGVGAIDGDAIIADVPTGNSRTIGAITLEAGEYPIEALFWERAGGSYFEVFGAQAGSPRYALLTQGDPQTIEAQPAVTLSVAPAPEMPVTGFELADDGMLTIEFVTLDPAGTHQLQESTDMRAWAPLEEATITMVEGDLFQATATVPLTDDQHFYRVALLPPPPLYVTDFEMGAEGWTIDNGIWELGMPTSGPGAARSGSNAFATVLDGPYPASDGGLLESNLRSPVIDLTDIESPRLSFYYYSDFSEAEGVALDFLDAGGSPILENAVVFGQGEAILTWTEFNRPIPEEARNQPIILQFRFLSDDVADDNGYGLAIDDLEID